MFSKTDVASLAAFRFLFGLIMVVDLVRYPALGWIDFYFRDPAFLFKFLGFGWVHPLPGVGMEVVFAVGIVAAAGVALGAWYRTSTVTLFLIHTYVFLCSATAYNNHTYLISVLILLMVFVPAQRALSVDAWITRARSTAVVPAWPRWLLLAQFSIVYVYGGIAKLNADWLAGLPLRVWLDSASRRVPLFGGIVGAEWFVQAMVYGGIVFDLAIVPLLLWRRTRVLALCASAVFHLMNAYVFSIGVFPWLMLAATTLFLDPSWPRRLPLVGAHGPPLSKPPPEDPRRTIVVALIGIHLCVQLVVPLRHHLYPGDVAWTDEGHMLSWRMKLRHKRGTLHYLVRAPGDPSDRIVDPADELTPRQLRRFAGKPDFVLQYAHHIAARNRAAGRAVEVRADALLSLNYRPARRFIDPGVDLAREGASLWPYRWILR